MPCNNLRGEMAKRRVTIEDIAALLDVDRNTVANKLNGKSAFSIDQAMKIQDAYFRDLELKWLFRRDDE